ncbi:MAG TPA: hypothetical protein VFG45_12460 [Candidatus Nitrosocosmicus sp.]|jgi:beta-galactosidase beta subunit|nr:hypothetical protein [Candidatus Nitrosocosmicus sp. SS]KAA2283083.1 hypothetical protein F1Z66_03110 [Candidatus Nitrosocosmicus sp. SS]KAF0868539.1 hypothetical protein E5N71_09140 [Candidatus Nitrosocosmicus sp. SS]MDR4490070.1 hypothetical protein [Candidatus Nitrosocosmicus sp.]HET6590962.1 hypothetical protein [Candidatus Nitrosocosmicus sp.]
MTFYEVRAKPRDNISDLRYDIDHGMIHTLIPFGKSLQRSLENAKVDNNKNAIWIEEDSNDPPLVSEREAVLDRYFSDIQIVAIGSEEDGWSKIKNNQSLWEAYKT